MKTNLITSVVKKN